MAKLLVHLANPHPVEKPAETLGSPGGKAEIKGCREPRHDFARIAPRLFKGHFAWHPRLCRMGHGRCDNLRIIGQPRHHVGSLGQLEKVDLAIQPRV